MRRIRLGFAYFSKYEFILSTKQYITEFDLNFAVELKSN